MRLQGMAKERRWPRRRPEETGEEREEEVEVVAVADIADADDEASIIASRPPTSSHLQGADELAAAAALESSIVPARRMAFCSRELSSCEEASKD